MLPLDTREEGEILESKEDQTLPPSKAFQDQLSMTQAEGSETVSNPVDAEMGLLQLKNLVEEKVSLGEEEEMEWDAVKASCREEGFDVDAADDLPDLTEEEEKDINEMVEGVAVIQEPVERSVITTEKGQTEGEEIKQQTTKKRLFKPPPCVAASNKLRAANALASPRKRAPAKIGKNHQEGKGSSISTSNPQKP